MAPALAALWAFSIASAPAMAVPANGEEGLAGAGTSRVIDNFTLIDHLGKSHELDYYCRMPGVRGIALFVHGVGCPLVQKRLPELRRLRDEYQGKGILFGMLNANLQDDLEDIVEEAREFGIDMPVLVDTAQLVGGMLGLKRTAEMLLIRTGDKSLIYRGPIDDRMSYQKEKPQAEKLYLAEALDALLSNKPVPVAVVDAPGCLITLPSPDAGKDISYSETIAPILMNKCASCHSKGGIGPFAMSSYRKVAGWSEMMREVVLTRQMPPWQADPHFGEFENDIALTPDEAQALVSWIDADCPRGEDGEDPLEDFHPDIPEWDLGAPDKLIELPEQEVAAEGVFKYRYVTIDSPFAEDVWLRGVQISPGNTRVLHHVIVTSHFPDQKGKRKSERSVAGYAPGMGAYEFPEGSGILLKKGTKLRFQLHYTASGKPETDRTRLGLYLAREQPAREFHTDVLIKHDFVITPGDNEFVAEKSRVTPFPILLYSMNPHMHYRGKWMRYEATLPDGETRTLLNVPNYHFNWQRDYHLKEPVLLPKGTRLTVKAAWDNSALNPHNPDPGKAVRWGDQSFEEMFFASYKFTVVEQGEAAK
jgi:hypothetical protein